MRNIVKAMLRQILRDRALGIGALYLLLVCSIEWVAEGAELRGSEAVMLLPGLFSLLFPIAVGTVTARICGADLRDRTANYEILFGKKRSEVYLSRVLASLLVCAFVTVVAALVPVLIFTLLHGWGASISVGNALLHFGMILPIMLRMVCFYAALTFLAGNDIVTFAVSIIGSMLILVSSFLLANYDITMTWHTGLTDLMHLLDFSNTGSGFFEGSEISVIKAALSAKDILRMLGTSFGFGLFWLLGGYAVFRRRDIP